LGNQSIKLKTKQAIKTSFIDLKEVFFETNRQDFNKDLLFKGVLIFTIYK